MGGGKSTRDIRLNGTKIFSKYISIGHFKELFKQYHEKNFNLTFDLPRGGRKYSHQKHNLRNIGLPI